MVRFSILTIIAAVHAASTKIYSTNVATGSTQELGLLSSSPEGGQFSPCVRLPAGEYCLGTETLECFSYVKVTEDLLGKFVVYYNGQDIDSLAFIAGGKVLYVEVEKAAPAPVPNLKPFGEEAKHAAKQKVIRKKTVEKDGEMVEVEEVEEEEEDQRSWVQRNWMYIVPPLIILLLLPDQEGEKK